ncbi:uncharacterized protein L969DRAFT_90771 [Mixia osmundae IAM 14324]|uniref:assimilatory sulfite reductase (NADPH) n=1 Tax=Mixia osmundae (strain CBS 9802 / IAM 14324 / JCM 22182 / KY 12970) TaxID=764103 RepID=G7DW40_MIXOS|nr:uncharacterized protein L969DRAFT_90771 [Mixia osmundae IAM 14324]KEI36456.1 hypothetical protein L969DRAFT_90771 [Mixia osmundae IAM 14324]GAA94846.1 hypothetical protein E5Q_01500 [Mixia osmundae IAM 14324]
MVGATASVAQRIEPLASHLVIDPPAVLDASKLSIPTTRLGSGGIEAGVVLTRLGKASKSSGSSQLPVTLVSRATAQSTGRLLSHLTALSTLPVVLHLVVPAGGDHASLASLAAKKAVLLCSSTAKEIATHFVVAARLAKELQQPIIHWFDEALLQELELLPSLPAEDIASFLSTQVSNGHADGNGHAPDANGDVEMSDGSDTSNEPKTALEVISSLDLPASLGKFEPISLREGKGERVVVALGSVSSPLLASLADQANTVVGISVWRPLDASKLASLLPVSTSSVAVVERAQRKSGKWSSFYLDIVSALNSTPRASSPRIVSVQAGALTSSDIKQAVTTITKALTSTKSDSVTVGKFDRDATKPELPRIPKWEQQNYLSLLASTFTDRFELVNSPESAASAVLAQSPISPTSPEYALGRLLRSAAARSTLRKTVEQLLSSTEISSAPALAKALTSWLKAPKSAKAISDALEAVNAATLDSPLLKSITSQKNAFERRSQWIIGSDAWAYDLGASGIHHALATDVDVNILIIDSQPYSSDLTKSTAEAAEQRKKDIGLYAMNYGNAYTASIAVYGDYSQSVRALNEADKFNGPSIVLAYLPGGHEDSVSALDVLKQTKLAIDSGYWPLYRWEPSIATSDERFDLDSERIKADLKAFLDRQNHLTMLSKRVPQFSETLSSSYGTLVKDAAERRAKAAFEQLTGAVDGPPLLVLYASDGGNAEKLAKKFTARARARGLGARVLVMDSFSIEDLALEPNVVLITSTAGQGEFPQNGRQFWKSLAAANTSSNGPQGGDGRSLDQIKFSVFALGDSHYWPRPEDAHYFNKSGKDLDKKLHELGAEPLADIGLGDDQDADGPQTAYKQWEPKIWKSLGVADAEVTEAEPEPITNEHIKIASNYLRGTIPEGLVDTSTGALAEADGQLTKFHGIYQQDDRDIREQRQEQGLEPAYSFMVRVRMPAGVCMPSQWLQIDNISEQRGNSTFKLTTRQTFQFHGIVKHNLKPAIQEINKALLDTIAACGDVNRNVMCSANPNLGPLHHQVHQFAVHLSEHLMPHTSAYAEIWLDKKLVKGDAVKDNEPLYGPYYLPRKFKIAIAVPPNNDVDLFANDVGFIAITSSSGQLEGFNLTIGGGMGVTHSNKNTYPRLADVIGFVTPEEAVIAAEKVMLVQRDNGDRTNRKHARLKYTVDTMGVDRFKAEVEKLLGYELKPVRPYHFDRNIDFFGWQDAPDGRKAFTCFIENGRVEDRPGQPFKTGLREIAKVHKGVFRLTGNQHLIIADIPADQADTIQGLLKKYHLDNVDFTGLRLSSSSCVALPTCGLSMAEAERWIPKLIDRLDTIVEGEGLRSDSIVLRVTGCPNGCARPWLGEVGLVGKAPGAYMMMLGGGYAGDRLNKPYKESVTEDEIVEILTPMIKRYAKERFEGEHFGDWTIRAGYIKPTTSGKSFYEDSPLA